MQLHAFRSAGRDVIRPRPMNRCMFQQMDCRRTTVVLWLAAACCAVVATRGIAAPQTPGEDRTITEFSLVDTHGSKRTLADWHGRKAVVLFFLGVECPVSNGYAPVMEELFAKYRSRGVGCYGVYAEPSVSADEAAAHAKDYRLTFPMLLDPAQQLARMAGARVTPDVIVASPDGRVLYRGRIDDRYSLDGKRRNVPRTHELIDAIEAVLAGKTPEVRETKAYGCPLPTLPRPAR